MNTTLVYVEGIEIAARALRSRLEHDLARTVYLLDDSSGRVHVGFQREGDDYPATFESCNADIAGNRREISESEANAKREKLRCLRCFPRRNEPDIGGEEPAPEPIIGHTDIL